MKIKMIVCDLDSTLLRTDGTFSQRTLATWEKCRSMGILLAFATARPKMAVQRLVDAAKPDIIITDGGALVRMNDEVIHRAILPKEVVDKIFYILCNSEHVGSITASTDDGHLTDHPITPEEEPIAVDYILIDTDFSKPVSHDIYKISPQIFDNAVVEEITALPNIAYMPFAGQTWGTFTLADVSKWHAVQKVAEHLKISIVDIVAFGDDFSDIEMLRGCGIGVAVDNAIPEVKAVADEICESNDDDGVAKWLEDNVCQ